jgi:hypothetical protein
MRCENEGCSVVVTQEYFEDHSTKCMFLPVTCPCPGCDTTVLRRNLPAHMAGPHDGHLIGLIKQNQELLKQQKEMELRMRQEVGVAVFEWKIARGWGGDPGTEICSQPVACGQFKICLVFCKLGPLAENGAEQFSFRVELLDEDVALRGDVEIAVASHQRAFGAYTHLLFPRMENVLVQGPGLLLRHSHRFSPSAEERTGVTLADGAIVARALVRLNLAGDLAAGRLPRVSDA